MRTGPVLMVISLMASAACGGDADATGAGSSRQTAATARAQGEARALSTIDACSLLTADEVRAILGQSAPGQPDTGGFDLACYWHAEGPRGRQLEVSVEAGRLQPESALREEYDTFKENMTLREDVGGIGDEAFLAQYSASGSALVIRANDLLVFINTTEPGQEDMLKTLGPGLLGRLR